MQLHMQYNIMYNPVYTYYDSRGYKRNADYLYLNYLSVFVIVPFPVFLNDKQDYERFNLRVQAAAANHKEM